jgi:vitamin B12 transporter
MSARSLLGLRTHPVTHALSGTTVRGFYLGIFFMKIYRFAALRAVFPMALALALSFPSLAQVAPSDLSLKEVVVTASRTAQRVRDALPSTTLISREDIDRSQAVDLTALLRNLTGLEVAQTGGSGTLASVFIRGAESRHTLVLIDGVPVNNLNFSVAALEHLPLSNVERIEVVRGNVSSLYGSAALGGVIQIFTRNGGDQPFGSVKLQAGSRGLAQMQLGAGVTLGTGTSLAFSAESLRDGGFNAIDQAKRANTNPDVDGYNRRSYSLSLGQTFAMGKISLRANESSGTSAYDSQFGPATQADESTFTLSGATLSGQFNLSPTLKLDVGLTSHADKLRAEVTAFPYFVNSFSEGGNLGLQWLFAKGQTLTAGAESTRQRIESDTVYNASSRQLDSARVGYQGDVGAHQWQVNLRQDRYSDFGNASTWLAAYAYSLTDALRISAMASTGFNAPTFNDLYYPFGGNARLRPEQVNSRELAVQYAAGAMEARATLFNNDFTDLIGNDATFTRTNIKQARNQGVELSYRARYGATGVQAGATFQDPQDTSASKRLDRRAATIANLGLTHDMGAWTLGTQLRYSGERPDGTQTLASYSVLDVNVAFALSPAVKLMGRIDNLLNARYETVYGYNQPGVGVFVGLQWQPKL